MTVLITSEDDLRLAIQRPWMHLARLCAAGRVYDVERWIQDGRPIQALTYKRPRIASIVSPLRAAIRERHRDVVLLLLCNGYRLDLEGGEWSSMLDEALNVRTFDILDLLLRWGADSKQVDTENVPGHGDRAAPRAPRGSASARASWPGGTSSVVRPALDSDSRRSLARSDGPSRPASGLPRARAVGPCLSSGRRGRSDRGDAVEPSPACGRVAPPGPASDEGSVPGGACARYERARGVAPGARGRAGPRFPTVP
jgi:hypothetical protein